MDQSVKESIAKTKRALGASSAKLKDAFRRLEDRIKREAEIIQEVVASGRSPLPEVEFASVKAGKVSDDKLGEIRKRGFAIIRGVFPRAQAEEWNEQLGRYIEDNKYYEKAAKKGKNKAKAKAKEDVADAEEPAPRRVVAVFFTHFIVQ